MRPQPPVGMGGSSRTPERRAPPAPDGQGALARVIAARTSLAPGATQQSGERPRWAGVHRWHASAARDPGPGGQGDSGRAPERRVRPRPTVAGGASAALELSSHPRPRWVGGSSCAPERRAPDPRIPFLNLKKFNKRYMGAEGMLAALARGRSPPAHRWPGTHASGVAGVPLPTGGRKHAPLWRAAGAPATYQGRRHACRSGAPLEPPAHRGRGCARRSSAPQEPYLPTGGTHAALARGCFSSHFRVCRFLKTYIILTLFSLDFAIFAFMKKHFSSNINQNCIWLMFDIKRQPKLYLVDV